MAEKHSCTYVYGCFLLYPNSIFIIFYGTVLAPLTTLSLLFRRKKAPKENLGSLKFTVILLYYSMIVATRPEPTVLPPSRYQTGVLRCANGDFSCDLCGKIRIFRCIRVVFGDFVIMVLSHYFNYSMTVLFFLTLFSQVYFYNIYPLNFPLYLVSFLPTKHHFL